jgi:hypothetical protein
MIVGSVYVLLATVGGRIYAAVVEPWRVIELTRP